MLEALKVILEVQELDMKMIQLMLLKRQRQKELDLIHSGQESLRKRVTDKETEIFEVKKLIRLIEGEHAEILEKIKKFELQQNSIKKVDEYNAITHEISAADRERLNKEQRLSDFYDKLAVEEDMLKSLKEGAEETTVNSKIVETEIHESIRQINEEGRVLKAQRDELVEQAEPEVFQIYERLLRNKKDRVVVPLENRCCSGCHIMLTAQHENLVRKGERLVFCEHCSRIHYWQESKALEDSVIATKQRRRRTTKTA
ncbi:zinc ribbon domain regulatory protein CdsZ [Candidatus Protochlamydia amoebophila]|uniref:zinc ribbon domain regulatory protein CdsZ n=1 Tax=Candidatus Protochlamydia amoebophila TaxID=362787 RepID=UPI001BC9FB51|nr:C4-type zinc ribbon domain-containing protein [Candidatus Protochlamydia amoebophila]